MSAFSKNMINARRFHRLTQVKVSEMIGIKRVTLASYEEGRAEPSFKTLIKICDVYMIHDVYNFISNEDFDINMELGKEEIFNKRSWAALAAISPSKDFCLKAMQEYADQEKKKEAIAFEEWRSFRYYHNTRTDLYVKIGFDDVKYTREQLYELFNQKAQVSDHDIHQGGLHKS